MRGDAQHVDVERLTWVGPLTVLASIAAVLVVRVVAIPFLPPATLSRVGLLPPILFTALLTTGAVVVFAIVALVIPRPIAVYQVIAFAALLLSFWPNVDMGMRGRLPWSVNVVLMTMHVVAWAVCVTMLTKLTRERRPRAHDCRAGALGRD